MAIDLSSVTRKQHDGQATIDGTLSNNLITLPGWVHEVHLYLADAAADGSFSLVGTASGRPLPKQTYVKVWAWQGTNPSQGKHIWVASGSGSQTLHYLLF